MSESDVLLRMLTTHDFVAVDQPLFSAIDLFRKTVGTFPHMPPFVAESLHAAHQSSDLTVKRAVWLVLLVMIPEMQSYVLSVGHAVKTPHTLAWLSQEAERLFNGSYQSTYGDEALSAFVTNAYNEYERA